MSTGPEVTIWFNPRCSTCQNVEELLAAHGVPAAYVHYLDTPPTRQEIERVLALLGTDDPRALARTTEPLWVELDLQDADREAVLDALALHPVLLQRPVVIRGDRAVVARPPELLLELLEPEQRR